MNLLIDCGNTRIKWAFAGPAGFAERGSIEHLDRREMALTEVAALAEKRPDSVFVASVLGDEYTAGLVTVLAKSGTPVHRVTTQLQAHQLRIAYIDATTLGVDRWLAMIAARARHNAPVCVVSAGTAVTFDAIDASGAHLGGFIWPGPRLVAEVLAKRTDRIGPTPLAAAPPKGLAILGRTTAEAVGNGSLFAIAAAIGRAVRIVADDAGSEPALLLTGGDASRLVQWLEAPAVVEPELVLNGLRIVANSSE